MQPLSLLGGGVSTCTSPTTAPTCQTEDKIPPVLMDVRAVVTLQRAMLDRPVSLVWIRAVPQGGAAPRSRCWGPPLAPSTVAQRLWGHTELKWREDTQTSNDEAVSTEVTNFLIVKTIRRGGGRGWGEGCQGKERERSREVCLLAPRAGTQGMGPLLRGASPAASP